MFFNITGSLLERLVGVAEKIKITVGETAIQALNFGLNRLGETQEKNATEATPSNDNPFLTMETDEEFIRKNYQTTSDNQLANQLNYQPTVVGIKRRALGLFKYRRNFGVKSTSVHNLPSILTEAQKQVVLEKLPMMRLRGIAIELGVPVGEVFRARNEIACAFISENWKKMSDSEMAVALGLREGTRVASIRHILGFFRYTLRKKMPDNFDPEELRKAIIEGGETLQGFIRRRGIPVTRERLRQIAGNFGIDTKQRTALWYANKYGHPELGDKTTIERLLAEKGRAPSAAAAVGLTGDKFFRLCKAHGITPPKNRPPAEMVELTCSQCGGKFKRQKALIEFQRSRRPEQTLWFCSKKCQGKRLGSLKGSGEMAELTCAVCGKSFKRYASTIKEGQRHFFCSLDCRYKLLPQELRKCQ